LAQGFAELIHNVYIGLFALAVILALWLPKTGKGVHELAFMSASTGWSDRLFSRRVAA
jgi:hypothetical protein